MRRLPYSQNWERNAGIAAGGGNRGGVLNSLQRWRRAAGGTKYSWWVARWTGRWGRAPISRGPAACRCGLRVGPPASIWPARGGASPSCRQRAARGRGEVEAGWRESRRGAATHREFHSSAARARGRWCLPLCALCLGHEAGQVARHLVPQLLQAGGSCGERVGGGRVARAPLGGWPFCWRGLVRPACGCFWHPDVSWGLPAA